MYEQNRGTYSDQLGIDFPTWSELSDESKANYLANVKTSAPAQQDVGFTKVAEQLETEGKGVRGAARVDLEKAQLAGQEQAAQTVAQDELAKNISAEAQAMGKGRALPQSIKEA